MTDIEINQLPPVAAIAPVDVLALDQADATRGLTIAQLDARYASTATITFAWGDASPKPLLTMPAGSRVLTVRLIVDTAFNGAGAALLIGDAGDLGRLLGAHENDPGTPGSYVAHPAATYGAETALVLTITPRCGRQPGRRGRHRHHRPVEETPMSLWLDLLGTTKSFLRIGLSGVRLKNNAGNLNVRNASDTADAEITAAKANVSGDAIDLNSDAAGAGADWKYTLQRPATGMTAAVALTLPPTDGSPDQVLKTDGSGVLSWADAASTASNIKVDSTPLAFDSTATVPMFNAADGTVVDQVMVIVDTPFDGSPSISVGTSGSASKYLGSGDVDLTAAARTQFLNHPGEPAVTGGGESLEIAYTANGATTGAARVQVHYATPS